MLKWGSLGPQRTHPCASRATPGGTCPGSFHALVMADRRVLVSVADGSGDVSWPDLPQVVTENPWHGTYRPE